MATGVQRGFGTSFVGIQTKNYLTLVCVSVAKQIMPLRRRKETMVLKRMVTDPIFWVYTVLTFLAILFCRNV